MLEKKKGEKAAQYISRVLLHNILEIDLEPGERLKEDELCDIFNVSRTPVREAIIELKYMHMIEVYPQKGIFVSLLNRKQIEEGQFLRMNIEPKVVERVCRCCVDEEFLTKQRETVVLMEYYFARDARRAMQLDQEFHERFYKQASLPFVYEIVNRATLHLYRMRKLVKMTYNNSYAVENHGEILDAVERGDCVCAREAVEKHLNNTMHDFYTMLERYPQYFDSSN